MDEVKVANTRAAIALVTALRGDGRTASDFTAETLVALVDELGDGEDERQGMIRLVIGMANLSGHLLMSLSRVSGVSEDENLRQLAVAYL